MWNLIVRFDKKMKKHAGYRMMTIFPRLLYRLLMWMLKKFKGLQREFKKHQAVMKEWFNQKKQQWEEFVESQSAENRALREKQRLLSGESRYPAVSVVMPVYNAEKYLHQAIQSILDQTFPHFELIVVDDGSTDGSLKILQEFASLDKRIRLLSQKNKFAGAARNLGMSCAKGKYLLFLDADDTFEPQLIQVTLEAALKSDAEIVVYGANYHHQTQNKAGYAKWLLNEALIPEQQPFSWKDCPQTIFQLTTAVPWTKLFERKFIRKNRLKFQRLHNANDVYFVFSALSVAERIVVVPEALVTYRMGQSDNLQSSTKRCFHEAYLAWKNKLKKLGIYEPLKMSYVNAALSSTLYNLSKVSDPTAQKQLYDQIRNDIFDELELCGHDESFYHDPMKAKQMHQILSNEYETYCELSQKQENKQ